MINKIRRVLFRQKLLGEYPGAILNIYSGAAIYQGIINSFLLIVTAYNTSMRSTLQTYFPWMTFWLFLIGIVVLNIIVMLLHYKFVLPSILAFSNRQGYQHGNPFKTDLAEVKRDLAEVKRDLTDIKNSLHEGEQK